MSLFKLNKDTWKKAHWWHKKKKDWAIQDKHGDWWIIPGSEMAEKKVTDLRIPKKKIRQSSMKVTLERMIIIVLACILGISLAFNLVYYIINP